jgi:hypothetical protein
VSSSTSLSSRNIHGSKSPDTLIMLLSKSMLREKPGGRCLTGTDCFVQLIELNG